MATLTQTTQADALIPTRATSTTLADAAFVKRRQTTADAYLPAWTTKTTLADAWIGEATRRTIADALLLRKFTKATTADAYRVKVKQTTADAYVTELDGSFRGVVSTIERDALVLKQPGDTTLNVDPEGGRHQYWTGTEWISGKKMQAPESRKVQSIIAPTEGGWRAEMGDPTYPFAYHDGAQRPFAVTTDGTIQANALKWSSGGAELASNYVTLPEPTGLAVPTLIQSTSGSVANNATLTVYWPSTPTAGNFLVACFSFRPVSGLYSGVSMTIPVGFSTAVNQGTGARIFYKTIAAGSETSVSVTFLTPACNARMYIAEYSGVASATDPVDVGASTVEGAVQLRHSTGTTPQTAQSSELWIGVITGQGDETQSFAASNGFTNVASGVTTGSSRSVSQLVGSRVASSIGTAVFETETTVARQSGGAIATFKAAPAPVAPPGTDKVRLYASPAQSTTTVKAKGSDGLELDLTSGAVLAVSTASLFVSNTTAQTSVLSYTIPAGIFTVGSAIEIEAWGNVSSQATSGTLTWSLFYDGVDDSSGWTYSSVVNARSTRWWTMKYVLQIADVVGLSNAEGYWSMLSDWPTTVAERVQIDYSKGSAHNFETTSTTVDFKVQWATASASNVMGRSAYNVRLYR